MIARVAQRATLVVLVSALVIWPHSNWPAMSARAQGLTSSQTQSATTPVKLGTAVILGRVVEDSSGAPVAGSSVCMWLQNTSAPQFCEVTDEKGRFLYRNLPAGSYHLVAEPGNFVRGEYGRTRPEGPARLIDVAEGARLMDVAIPVFKVSVISGTVIDEAGEPVVHASVEAALHRPSFRPAGTWTYTFGGGTVLTDDRGRYRLHVNPGADTVIVVESAVFATVSSDIDPGDAPLIQRSGIPRRPGDVGGPAMAAGDLLLRLASGTRPALAPPPLVGGAQYVYPTTFYPSARTPDQATIVRLALGEERGGVDIQLQLQRGVRVSGRVTSEFGSAAGLTVSIRNQYVKSIALTDSFETALALTDASGRFTLAGVPAGEYVLTVVQKAPPTPAAPASSIQTGTGSAIAMGANAITSSSTVAESALSARQSLSVAAEDVTGVDLVLHTGFRATGEIKFDGAAPPAVAAVRRITAGLFSVDGPNESMGYTPVEADGRFATPRYPPGLYTLSVGIAPPPPGWMLRSVVWRGHDVTHRAVTLDGEDLDGIVVTFTDHLTSLSGVVGSGGVPDAGTLVVAFPTDFRSSPAYADVVPFPSVRVSASGSYALQSVWPGDYFVAAIDDSLSVTWTDCAFLDQLAKQASRVTLREGDKLTQDLRRVTVR